MLLGEKNLKLPKETGTKVDSKPLEASIYD